MRISVIHIFYVWILVTYTVAQDSDGWGEWGDWSVCSAECNVGLSHRTRTCIAATCAGDATEEVQCNSQPCQIDTDSPDVGCYVDTTVRDLRHAELVDNATAMTREACIDACSASGFFYAAVQKGKFCFCGNSYGRYGKALSDEECMANPCTKDGAPLCGGNLRNSIFSTEIPIPPRVECPNGGLQYGDDCFILSTTAKPWIDAQRDCANMGGYLARINDAATQAFIELTITRENKHQSYTFGLNDISSEGLYSFADGAETPLAFDNFNDGEPSDTANSVNCAELKETASYEWNDVGCGGDKAYICQTPLVSDQDVTCGVHSEGVLYNSKCYILVENELSFDDAVSDCAMRRGMLASITDKETQMFLYKHILRSTSTLDWYFGLNDKFTEGVYLFRDGTALNRNVFNRFAYQKPDEDTATHDCIVLDAGENYLWDDASCSVLRPYICETDTSPQSICSPEWHEYNGHCYLLNDKGTNNTDSVKACTYDGKEHLLKLDSVDELNFITATYPVTHVWLGMQYYPDEDVYKWFDGSDLDATLDIWDIGEPDNDVTQICTFIHKTTGLVRDQACSTSYIKTVCEMIPL
ncbi:macrophage mannose receptor 1-like [Saccoglossus kowalevskii]|uniref:Macrophage mannose receptor 1-like n=1 Tax=Saccoglossus kowalevskii TaxID=10224 RepID=A0ABM0GJ44_SACKO|nr:PREDICTED: macrophage mannose receptor 1-like [Saccoglossus kowalevskii]